MNIKSIYKLLVLSIVFSCNVFNNSAFAIASEPTVQTFSLTATPGSCSEIDLFFLPGDGSKRIVICSPDVPVSMLPQDGVGYTAGSIFKTGSNLGNNNYVVYNAGGTSTTITGLDGGTEYFFAIFELNGNGNNSNYLLPGYLEANTIAPGFTMTISSTSGDMCSGDSVRLEVHGADTYEWSPSGSLSSSTDPSVWAKPNSTTQYTVDGADNSGCIDRKTITITVYSKPNVTLSNFSDLCIDDSRISINSGSPSGGNYSGDGVSGTHFYPNIAGIGRHIITYTYSDIHGCSSSDTSSVLVSDIPEVNFSSLSDVCIVAPAFTLNGGSPSGGTYSGNGVSSGQFSPGLAGVGQHEITYTYTNSSGCSKSAKRTIRVRALPTVTFATLPSVCLNTTVFNLTGGSPSGGHYTGIGVNNSQFSPLVSGAGTFLINYSYTDSFNCSSQDTSYITVRTLPAVSFSPISSVCQNTGPVTLSGGSPVGGTYSGSAVGSGKFYTGIAGPGQHTIIYTYSNIYNCSNTATQTITVNAAPIPNLGKDTLVCSSTPTFLNAGSFNSYLWSTGARTQTISVDSTGKGFGTFAYSIIVTNSFGCVNKDTILVTFDQCNGINDLDFSNNDFSVFPNPFSSEFTIITKEGSDIYLFDIKGSLIMENKNSPSVFSFGEKLPSGCYFIQIRNKQFNQYKLLIKN